MNELLLIITLCGVPKVAILPKVKVMKETVITYSIPYIIPEEYRANILYLMKKRKLQSYEIDPECTSA